MNQAPNDGVRNHVWSREHEWDNDPADIRLCDLCSCAFEDPGDGRFTHCPGTERWPDWALSSYRWIDAGKKFDFVNGEWVEGELSILAAREAFRASEPP